jgi:maleate isomerase
MQSTLPAAARLLPPAAAFDVIGYGCTSGTTLIGADRVRDLVQCSAQTQAMTEPLTAALTGIRALCLQCIGIVSLYIPSVAEPFRAAFEAQGIIVSDSLSFGEEVEARVARIDSASIREAAMALAQRATNDGVLRQLAPACQKWFPSYTA